MKAKNLILGTILGALSITGIAYLTVNKVNPFHGIAEMEGSRYNLTLNSSNSYTSGSTKSITSNTGFGHTTFSYANCSSTSEGHVFMSAGGKIKNTQSISSISELTAQFEGSLEFRYSYDGETWSDDVIAKSGKTYYFEDEPGYIELFANQHSVLLKDLKISYKCEVVSDSFNYATKSAYFNYDVFSVSSSNYTFVEDNGYYLYGSKVRNTGSYIAFPSGSYVVGYYAAPLKSISITVPSGKSFSGYFCSGTEFGDETHSQTITSSGTYTIPDGDTYFFIENVSKTTYYLSDITVNYAIESIDPISFDVLPNDYEITAGTQRQMFLDYYPSLANNNLGATWISSDTSIATVDETGLVTVNSSAPAGSKFNITAVSTYNPSIVSTAELSVVSSKQDEWTIMVYMCGADLESEGGAATSDIMEMLEVNSIPDDVNILIYTGGANSWSIDIDASKNHILRLANENNKTVLQDTGTTFSSYNDMGDPDTLSEFVTIAVTNNPANKYGLIFWNHGGAMRGCCNDEKTSGSLSNSEIRSALDSVYSANTLTEKMEFIGYDCCLMGVQDIANTNSKYAKYMIASEESEAGSGWDYDNWIDDLYMNKPTNEILRAVCDSFIRDNDGLTRNNPDNDQTLAYYDLSYADKYLTTFESFATALTNKVKSTSTTKSTIRSLFNNVKTYAVDDEGSETYFAVFDVIDFLDKLEEKSFAPDATYIDAVREAYSNLVEYSKVGLKAGNSNGMTLFYAVSSNASQTYFYTNAETNFSNWLSFNRTYGY